MNDITTVALFNELYHRMEHHLYDESSEYDAMLTELPKEDTMGMYFAIEEFLMVYMEMLEERRHM